MKIEAATPEDLDAFRCSDVYTLAQAQGLDPEAWIPTARRIDCGQTRKPGGTSMSKEDKITKLQEKIRKVKPQLEELEIDNNGVTINDVTRTIHRVLGWRSLWNAGGKEVFRVAMRREGWQRRRASRRWFHED